MKCFCRPSGPCSNRSALFQRMYALRDDPEARRAYLDTIPRELIERLSLFVPEVTLKWPSTMPELNYLFAKDADVSFKNIIAICLNSPTAIPILRSCMSMRAPVAH